MMSILIIIVLSIILFIFGYFTVVYNRFQTLKNGADATLNQIKVALKKRLDLISQLVDSVKSYANFEKSTLIAITKMRSSVMKIEDLRSISNVERTSRELLSSLKIAVENYPDLKTSATVQQLMTAIQNIEDEIARHRYTYNNIVQEFNTKIDTFPSNVIALLIGLKKLEYLKFDEYLNKKININF